ncbi:MAG TPA: DUF2799 domain-containing protein [Burkholderiaceae bacterium]|jgi:hypothetical protein|nr:DUF2799 domain-containing protein [Burkholderiaceae bacterium]
MRLPLLLACLLALGGCASISAEDCPRVDWYQLGVKDGREGRPESRLHEHRQACRDVGVRPDERAWTTGRFEGLRSYCTLGNALSEGRAGNAYHGVCQGSIEAAFRELHGAAFAVHDASRRVRELETQISSRERDLRRDGLSDRDRDRIRSDIRDMDRRRESARSDMYRRERDLDFVRQRYRI